MKFVLALLVASALFSSAAHGATDGALPRSALSDSNPPLVVTPEQTSQAERGPHLQRRSLLQFQPSQCLWNILSSECEIGDDALESLMGRGKSAYARFYSRQYKCATGGRTKKACAAMSDCGWLPDGWCSFVDYVGVYPKSPCVKNASRARLFEALLWQCPMRNSAGACSRLFGCIWDGMSKTCFVNEYEVFFGIEFPKDFDEQSDEVDEIKATALLTAALSNETFVSMDSYWNSFLEWQVPKTECPKGYDQLVCDYVDAYFAVLLPTYFYCFANAQANAFSPKDCSADSLCEYERGQCRQTQNLTAKALGEADKQVLLPLIPGSKDRKIMENSLSCSRMTTESECTGNCRWVASACLCEGHPGYRQEVFISGVEDPTADPVCLAFNETIENGCGGVKGINTCNTNEKCDWYPESDLCSLFPAYLARTLIEQDPELKKPYDRFVKSCSMHKSREECLSA